MLFPEKASPLSLKKNGENPWLKSPFFSRGAEKRGKVVAQPPPSASVSSAPSTGGTNPAARGLGNTPSCTEGMQNQLSGFASIGGGR